MSDQNLQDVLSIVLSTAQVLGQAIQVGTDAGAKSLILSNDLGAVHVAANPPAGTITINLPTGGGTIGLLTAISAGTTLVSIGQVVLSNSNGISFGMNGGTITATVVPGAAAGIGAIQAGTQTQTSGTMIASNSNGISFGLSNSSVLTASADYVRSVSAGTTNATGNQIILSNSNGLSFAANGATITATADYVRSISAGTTNATGNQLILSNSNGVSFGANGATITASVAAAGGGITLSYFNPQDAYIQVTGDQGNGSLHVQPAQFPNVTFDRVAIPLFFSASTASLTVSYTYLWGVFTRNASTLSLLMSTSITGSVNNQGTSAGSLNYGVRLLTIPFTSSLGESQYWIGIMKRSSTAGANATMSQILASQQNSNFSGIFGVASNATIQYTRGLGVYTASTTAMPASIAYSQLNGSNSLVLRQPMFYVVSGTV